MQIRYDLVGRHSKTPQLVHFAILADLPEDHVALPTHRDEGLRARQILRRDYFFPVHREPAIELVQLLAMEKKHGSFGQAKKDELLLVVLVVDASFKNALMEAQVEHLCVEWQNLVGPLRVEDLHAGDLLAEGALHLAILDLARVEDLLQQRRLLHPLVDADGGR